MRLRVADGAKLFLTVLSGDRKLNARGIYGEDDQGEATGLLLNYDRIEGLGAQLFSRVEGDYFTILGLPLLPLLDYLRGHKVIPQ